MMKKLQFPSWENVVKFLNRYKYVLVVILAGTVLLLLPGKDEKAPAAQSGMTGYEEDFSVDLLEEKLSKALSKISGAGDVSVVLTVRSGMERILAADLEHSQDGDGYETREKTVVISTDNGEEVVLVGQNYPVFQGALVVCRGGDDPEVQLRITKAVAALTGLSTGRITVCKGS